jgi:GNAT superfamily N-acetyltransferase
LITTTVENSTSVTLLPSDENTLFQVLPLMACLHPNLELPKLAKRLKAMFAQGSQFLGAYEGGELVGVAIFWMGTRLWCGKCVEIDNVVVAEAYRSRHIGKQLIEWIESWASSQGCEYAMLDADVVNVKAHKFYARIGFEVVDFHFVKKLG